MENVALAMPVLLLFIGIEYFIAKKKKLKIYEFNDTVTNMSIGILDRVSALLIAGLFYFVYDYLYQHFSFFQIPNTWYTWVILFVIIDFLFYWYHRFGHEINIFWSVHVVHHSSDEYNFTVGSRITIFQTLIRMLFWLILPIIGFNAEMIMLCLMINGVLPFFVHTQLINKLHPIIEFIFVTPSHHKVHHGSNEIYLDKNYGGILIIWDRIFGTFQEETETVNFGLTKTIETRSLLWHFFHYFLELYYTIKQTSGFRNKLKILFGKPDLIPADLRPKLEKKFLTPKPSEEIQLSSLFKNYIIAQIGASVLALTLILYFYDSLAYSYLWVISFIIVVTLINCGALLEQKSWVFYLEYFRLLLFGSLVYLINISWLSGAAFTLIIMCLIYFNSLKNSYIKHLYNESV